MESLHGADNDAVPVAAARHPGRPMRGCAKGEQTEMSKTFAIGLVVVVGLFVGACSVFGGKAAEEPQHKIVLADGDIEVRAYQPYAVAWTTAQGPFDEAVRTGFRRLFEYITGANTSASDIEMTAPVLTEPKSLETGAIVAAPQSGENGNAPTTLAGDDIDGWSIGFVLPAGYTAATAPVPTSADINVSDVAARCVASIGFSGNLGNEAGEEQRRTLSRWIEARGLDHRQNWQLAGYNPPWTIPMLRRNEVLVTLASCP